MSFAFTYPIACNSQEPNGGDYYIKNITRNLIWVATAYLVVSIFAVARCVYLIKVKAKTGWRKNTKLFLNVMQTIMNLMFFVILIIRYTLETRVCLCNYR
jgi:ABC-type proline/glycine betaine transport system permease subunit